MPTLGTLVANISANITNFQSGINKAQNMLNKFSSSATKTGAVLTATISAPLLKVGKDALKMAMDAVESENLFDVSMGKMANSARDWSIEYSKALGLNQYETRKNLGTMYTMIQSMGLSEKSAYGMSQGVVSLANDMASFYNISSEDAFEKITAGITGEAEPLKRLGILVNDNTIKQYALNHGMIKSGQTMSEQQKVAARWGVILEGTSKAQGDMARTIDSPANKLRSLQARWDELQVTIGQKFLPILVKVATAIGNVLTWFENLSTEQQNQIIKWAAIAAAAGPVLVALGGIARAISFVLSILKTLASVLSGIAKFIFTSVIPAINSMALSLGISGGAMFAIIAIIIVLVAEIAFLAVNWQETVAVFSSGVQEAKMFFASMAMTALGVFARIAAAAINTANSISKAFGGGNIIDPGTVASFINNISANLKSVYDSASAEDEKYKAKASELAKDRLENSFLGTGIKLPKIELPNMGDLFKDQGGGKPVDLGDIYKPVDFSDLVGGGADGAGKAAKGVNAVANAVEDLANKVKDSMKSIADQIGVFDQVSRKSMSTATLLNRAKRRYKEYEDATKAKEALLQRSELSDSMKAQIANMDVSQADQLLALSKMSSDQLKQWNQYGVGVENLSKQQAQNAVYNTELNIYTQSKDADEIAEVILKKLKAKGVKI